MAASVAVHPRVPDRHPDLSEQDVTSAWRCAIAVVERTGDDLPSPLLVAVGSDSKGRLVEMVAAEDEDGGVCIFHAMTPPSVKTLSETGLSR